MAAARKVSAAASTTRFAARLVVLRQLRDAGRLARAINADDQHHREQARLLDVGERRVCQQLDQFIFQGRAARHRRA